MEALRALLHDLEARLTALFHWVESFADKPYGGTALFVLAFAESSFFPIPPDVLLIPLCLGDPSKAFWFAGLCTAGSVLGGAFGYGLGYWGGRPLVRKMFRAEKVAAVERLYEKYNAWATGVAGLTPLPYKIFTVSGGAFAVNFRIFLLASLVGRGLRFFAVAALLYAFGEPIQGFIDDNLGWLSVAFVILLIAGFWLVGRGFGRAGKDGGAAEAGGAGGGDGEVGIDGKGSDDGGVGTGGEERSSDAEGDDGEPGPLAAPR